MYCEIIGTIKLINMPTISQTINILANLKYYNINLLIIASCLACSIWKFPGQELNLCHSSDNAGCLTHCTTKEL